jgi:hypothetical protein
MPSLPHLYDDAQTTYRSSGIMKVVNCFFDSSPFDIGIGPITFSLCRLLGSQI